MSLRNSTLLLPRGDFAILKKFTFIATLLSLNYGYIIKGKSMSTKLFNSTPLDVHMLTFMLVSLPTG